jgi:hypothetical protein
MTSILSILLILWCCTSCLVIGNGMPDFSTSILDHIRNKYDSNAQSIDNNEFYVLVLQALVLLHNAKSSHNGIVSLLTAIKRLSSSANTLVDDTFPKTEEFQDFSLSVVANSADRLLNAALAPTVAATLVASQLYDYLLTSTVSKKAIQCLEQYQKMEGEKPLSVMIILALTLSEKNSSLRKSLQVCSRTAFLI